MKNKRLFFFVEGEIYIYLAPSIHLQIVEDVENEEKKKPNSLKPMKSNIESPDQEKGEVINLCWPNFMCLFSITTPSY